MDPSILHNLRNYRKHTILNQTFTPVPLNMKLTSNPFLEHEQKYKFILYKLTLYNQNIQQGNIKDKIETNIYEHLHSIICDIVHIDSKQMQLKQLDDVLAWFQLQERLINQRKDQGQIRYKVVKSGKGQVLEKEQEQQNKIEIKVQEDKILIPSDEIKKAMYPFKMGLRTNHKELQSPSKRLGEYKRKILNFSPFPESSISPSQTPRILYPKIPKFEPHYDDEQFEQPNPEIQLPQNQQNKLQQNIQNPQNNQNAVPPQEQEQKDQQQQNNNEQDLGGFGQQPGQPQQQEPVEIQSQDKLAPKIKSFTIEFQDLQRKHQQNDAQKRMENKYLLLRHNSLKKQSQEQQLIQHADQWALAKSKVQKDRQKKIQNKLFSQYYTLSPEKKKEIQMLAPEDQAKYQFPAVGKKKSKHSEINLSAYHLPKIQSQGVYEKTIKKDRLKSLKQKYSSLLNITDTSQRERVQTSICQVSARKRGFSQVLRKHSKSKERLKQLDEIIRLKQKLAQNRIGVNINCLSQALCIPENDDNPPQQIFASKDLPSNPFFVEVKKKKKKK